MPRWSILAVVIALLVGARPAEARMMVHYDLAGLLLQSDAVVIADRLGAAGDQTRYRIVRSLRGSRQVGTEVAIYDRHFNTTGHAIDARAVLFLTTHDGKPSLVPSGLRVLAAGKVWRFEQQDNPGPYRMVPQGRDPQDQWGLGGSQLDLAGLEAAIAAAGRRVDALAAASAIGDPAKRRAALLALFTRGAPATTFYLDVLAERAKTTLAAAGDLEGALLVELADRGPFMGGPRYAKVGDLVAFAADVKKPLELRVAALDVTGRGFGLEDDPVAWRAATALLADPAPEIRAAAVLAASQPAKVTTSDPAEQRQIDALVAEARIAIAKRYVIEQDPRVLAAAIAAFQDSFEKPLPARRGPRLVAVPRLADAYVDADVYCVRSTRVTGSEIVVRAATGAVLRPAFNVTVHCDGELITGGLAVGAALPAGTYQLILELAVAGAPKSELSLGTLIVDARGERQLR